MNYLIIFDDVTGTLNKNDFHDKIKNHLSVTDWWHYLSNAYIITTSVTTAGLTNSLSGWFPGLLFLIIEVSFNSASGVLPKEAFDWIRNKSGKYVRVRRSTLPNIKITPSTATSVSGASIIQSMLSPIIPDKKAKPGSSPWTIEDFLKSAR